jgi:hypothetical protein
MFGPHGNPTTSNFSEIVAHLQQVEGVRFEARSARTTSPPRKRPWPHRAIRATSTAMSR